MAFQRQTMQSMQSVSDMLVGGYPFYTSSLTIMVQPKMGPSNRIVTFQGHSNDESCCIIHTKIVGNPGAVSRPVQPAGSKGSENSRSRVAINTKWVFQAAVTANPEKVATPQKKHDNNNPVSSQTGIIKYHQTWFL